ncbi:MAG: SDR family oxidoreductase [Actinomycetota bacterium]
MSAELFSIEGKAALVTGGSRGIGRMIAGGFVRAGARVYISSRNAAACDEVTAELSTEGTCASLPADLSSREGCEALVAALGDREERLHILINNAGATWGAPLEEYPDEGFDKVMTLNVKSVFNLTRLLLPSLRAAATPQDPARVVVIGSIDGIRVPDWDNFGYSASKAAVAMLGRHLAQRLAREHITVNTIAPGLFPSKMTKFMFESGAADQMVGVIPLGRAGTPEDIAGTAIFLCSRAGAYLTGAVIPVDGGISTHG